MICSVNSLEVVIHLVVVDAEVEGDTNISIFNTEVQEVDLAEVRCSTMMNKSDQNNRLNTCSTTPMLFN